MSAPDMEVIKEIPGYKVILKAVLKNQIQQLVETLAQHTDEESVILTASVSDGTLSHLGSSSGKFFLEDHEDVKSQFLGFCLKRHHRQKQAEKDKAEAAAAAAAARNQPPVMPTQMGLGPAYSSPQVAHRGRGPRSTIARHASPRHSMPSARHEPYPVSRPQKQQRNSIDNQSFEQGAGQMTLPTSTAGGSFVKQEPADGDNSLVPSSSQVGDSNQGPDDDSNLSSDATLPHTPSNNDNMASESDLDPNVNVKLESRGESELEITGVEPSKMDQVPDNWVPDPKMLYDGTGATGNQGDMPGGSQDLYTTKGAPEERATSSRFAAVDEAEMEELSLDFLGSTQDGDDGGASSTRFGAVDNDDMAVFLEANQASSTKKNTKWGIKLFQDWHVSVFGEELDMMKVKEETLASKLSKFYCEARQQGAGSNTRPPSGDYYHTNTLKNIRSAVNRHMQDIGRNICIVKDKEFAASNKILTGLMKTLVASGILKPPEKKDVIAREDLVKIYKYLGGAPKDPFILRQCVYYQMAIHFCTSGLDFISATRSCLKFHVNEKNVEYLTLDLSLEPPTRKSFQTAQPQPSEENYSNKRMYANGMANCPVKMIRLMIDRTAPDAEALFNSVNKDSNSDYWYYNKPLSKRTISKLMSDICKGSECRGKYTAYSIKATAKSVKTDTSFELRSIMFM